MKITLQNYPTAAANVDTSRLDENQIILHEQLLEFGEELLDGANETTRQQYSELLALLNGQNGGSTAENPRAEVKAATQAAAPKARAPRTARPPKETAAAKAAPASKKPATTRTAKPKPEPAGGNVRGISPSVALIRGFVQLLGKEVPGSRVNARLRAVQAAMSDGRVTAKSPHGKVVDEVQDLLIKAVEKMGTSAKPDALVKLNVTDDEVKAKLVGIAGGETVFESVAVLRAYVRLSGKKVTKEQIANLLKRTDSAKIKAGDPFQEELKDIRAALKKAKPGQELAPTQVGLSGTQRTRLAGLAGIVRAVDRHATIAQRASVVRRAVAPKKKSPARRGAVPASRAASEPGAGTITRRAASPAAAPVHVVAPANKNPKLTSADLVRQQFKTFFPIGDFAPLLGKEVEENFAIMAWGNAGQGKTTLLIKFARWYAKHYGKVAYIANEEFGRGTLQSKVVACGGSVPGLDFYKHIITDAEIRHEGYKLIIFDSQRTLKLTLDEFKAFTIRNPHIARIVVMQATKAGTFKGENDWPHEVDIELEAFGPGKARTTKNRFAPLREITIF